MTGMRYQPQGLTRLDRSRRMFIGAQGIVSAPHVTNLATGVPLKTLGGSSTTARRFGVPQGLALPFRQNWYVETELLPAIGAADYTEFWVGYPSSGWGTSGNAADPAFVTGSSLNQTGICTGLGTSRTQTGGSGSASHWGAVRQWNTAPFMASANDAVNPGELTVLIVVRRANGMEFWRNGVMVNFVAQAAITLPAQTFICGSFISNTAWASFSDTMLAGRTLGAWTGDEIRMFSAGVWPTTFVAPSDDGDTDLLAAPANDTSLTASGSAVASAIAALTTALPLSGLAVASTAAVGTLSTAVRLTGSAIANAIASASLAGGAATLSGGAQVASTVTGTLSTKISLAGTGVGRVAGSGMLLTKIPLSGAALAAAAANAALGNAAPGIPGIDISKIPPCRIVVFEGSGSRIVPFDGSGSRVVVFDGSGSRTVEFQ